MSEEAGRRVEGPAVLAAGDALAPGYRVVAHLRRGEDLDVYDVWSDERECRCVAKSVRPDRLSTPGARARVLREGRLLLRLTHPHIVRAYDVIDAANPVVILETLPGETLAHLVDRTPRGMSAIEVSQLGLHLCSAVGYLHRYGVLHLDLKPSNIIAVHGLAKVLDLSLARPPGRHRGGIGTPGYMAPEQCVGGELGPWTDVWGIGVTLHEAATGEPACDAGDETLESDGVCEPCVPRPLRRWRRWPALAGTINQCLSAKPNDRPTLPALAAVLATGVGNRPPH